ncbi:uncharacterized protein LOC143566305 [Bidens hawaiensis]|uniref:uncharacterized protein LOC143566305 n=1 Tax=Bidens hawaiensis TaxID=980011 RepID=UPI004049A809
MPPTRGASRGAKDVDQGPPEEVVEVSSFVHACEGDAVTKLINKKVPYFNAPIYLQNKTQIGKVDEIFGPINQSYFSVKMSVGIMASSYAAGDKFYIDPAKLLPLNLFLFDNRNVFPSNRSLTSRISSTRKKKRKLNHKKINGRYDSAVDYDNSQAEEKVEPETEEQIKLTETVSSDLTIEHEVTQVQSREDSIELRYEDVKKHVAGKLDSAQQAVAAVSAKWKEIFRNRRKAAGELNLASVKYKEMEKELQEAVESEDFETAERVSDGLVSAEKNKEVLLIALREAETEFDVIDSKMQEALDLQIVAAEECTELLKSFAVVSLLSLLVYH